MFNNSGVKTQGKANFTYNQAYLGQIMSGKTYATLSSINGVAYDSLKVGNFAYLVDNAIFNKEPSQGSTIGFVARNEGYTFQEWSEIEQGYSESIAKGSQIGLITYGDVATVVVGCDADGKADHIPLTGEKVYINNKGEVFCSSAEVTSLKDTGWVVTKSNLKNFTDPVTKENGSLCQISKS